MELNQALKIANNLIEKLSPLCEKIDLAGSCRRTKPEVKDIEICLIPRKEKKFEGGDMFSPGKEVIIPLQIFTDVVIRLGKVEKGNTHGKYMKIILPEEIILDLFIPDDFDYYRQFAIRTGSADYSFKIIAAGWRKLGWCGSDVGLRKTRDCIETKKDGKSSWKCVNPHGEKPPLWKSEKEFFEWLGVKYLEPSKRNI